jgi:hypothetical protein
MGLLFRLSGVQAQGGLGQYQIQPQFPPQLIQEFSVDNTGTHFGQKTLLFEREFSEQVFGHHQVQHRIAQEFQSLVGAVKTQGFVPVYQRMGKSKFE